MLGKSGFRVRAVGPGGLVQVLPATAVDRRFHNQLRAIPAFLLVPTAVWQVDRDTLCLASVECVEHILFGLRGEEALKQAGWRHIVACALAKDQPTSIPKALTFRNNRKVAALIGPHCPSIDVVRGRKTHPTFTPLTLAGEKCLINRCARDASDCTAFCADHIVESSPAQILMNQLSREILKTPDSSRQVHKWLIQPYLTQGIGMLTAAALYFRAEQSHIEMLRRLGRYLISGFGVDEMIVVAAGIRPVRAQEAGTWARVFGCLGRHGQLHALNAVALINTTDRLTREHKQEVATSLAVYGITHEQFEPNLVSSVAPKLNGAWDFAKAAQLKAFADGAIVKLSHSTGVALYTAVYAAAVLTDKIPHSFTWSVIDPTREPRKQREFTYTFDGWGFSQRDLTAMETVGSGDEVLVRNAGMLSWSALFRLITVCRATVFFHASVHFASVAVYCRAIRRHVGGPFALLYHAAGMTDRIDRRLTQPHQLWVDVQQAIGPQAAGTELKEVDGVLEAAAFGVHSDKCAPCAQCNEVHLYELWAHETHAGATRLSPCAEAALTYGASIEKLKTAAMFKISQLIGAAEELALCLRRQ